MNEKEIEKIIRKEFQKIQISQHDLQSGKAKINIYNAISNSATIIHQIFTEKMKRCEVTEEKLKDAMALLNRSLYYLDRSTGDIYQEGFLNELIEFITNHKKQTP